MGEDDIELLGKETCFRGYFRIDRYRFRHRRFDHGWTGEFSREVFERGHAVAVLPYDPERDSVVLVEQFRAGAYAAGWHPWLLEAIAGIMETDETPEAVARREAREEANLTLGRLIPITRYLVSPGGTSETCSLFCAPVDAGQAGAVHGGVHGQDGENEHIKVHVMSRGTAYEMVEKGEIANAMTIVALQWLQINRGRITMAETAI